MITAKIAREKSIETQMHLVENFIQTAIENDGFKSICITDELEESLYDEVIQELLHNGFDIISKIYTSNISEFVSWENGKETNGLRITLDCRLMDSQDGINYFLYPTDETDDGSDYY